jgi:hypothetical protein
LTSTKHSATFPGRGSSAKASAVASSAEQVLPMLDVPQDYNRTVAWVNSNTRLLLFSADEEKTFNPSGRGSEIRGIGWVAGLLVTTGESQERADI